MKSNGLAPVGIMAVSLVVLGVLGGRAVTAQDAGQGKYTVQVPGGLAFSEFRGYESWQTVSISHSEKLLAVTLANPEMIKAFQSGIPGNGKPFPDGSKMAKIHWNPKKHETFPTTVVPDSLHDVDFVVKGVNWSDAASYLNAAHPHPPLSANRLLSFTMKSTSCRLAGTVVLGNVSCFFGFQWIFAILAPSGKGLPLPGMPDW